MTSFANAYPESIAGLDDYIGAELQAGQRDLAATVRQLVSNLAPSWLERMDSAEDRVFLQPALFAWLTAGRRQMPASQLFYGLTPEQNRPLEVDVQTDKRGDLAMPGYCWFATRLRNRHLRLYIEPSEPLLCRVVLGRRYRLPVEAIATSSAHGITSYHRIHPLLNRFCDSKYERRTLDHSLATECHLRVAQAFDWIQVLDPVVYNWICSATRVVQLYSAEQPNSFATLSAHGAAFLNIGQDHDLLYFIDDLSHQCGHIVFNAVTREKAGFFTIDPHLPLQEMTRKPDESRDLYAAFHGLFTYTLITRMLHLLLASDHLDADQRHHCLGRLWFYLLKFFMDLQNLANPKVFTERGRLLYNLFVDCYQQLYQRYAEQVSHLDLSNQPYVFNLAAFLALNPRRQQRL